jgi:DNA-3-methyladenine glycosylase I
MSKRSSRENQPRAEKVLPSYSLRSGSREKGWEAWEMNTKRRCWGDGDPLMEAYHDDEWGIPVHDDRELFEFLLLESFQAGLSWRTILHKRENFREAFANFDPAVIAQFTEMDEGRLKENPGIVRNRLKIRAAIGNAKAALAIRDEFGSLDQYLWSFTENKPLRGSRRDTWDEIQSTSRESDAMSAGLKARGMKFVGSTICYAFMQAVGMVDDHLAWCFRAKA